MYEGYIESVEYGASQTSNLPMLTVTLRFPYDDGEGEKERTLRWYLVLKGDGAGRSKASLAKLDPELDLANLEPDTLNDHFEGAEVRIRVTIRPDRDDPKIKRNNVADVTPIGEDF